MSYKNYDNNKKQPITNVYTPISFANPDGSVAQSRFSISYFNRLMRISIANKVSSDNQYPTYEDKPTEVYVSADKAKILYNLIQMMKKSEDIHNVEIELKGGLLMISDGKEYKSGTPCFAIMFDNDNGKGVKVYQTKINPYRGAYNYSNGNYSVYTCDDYELETLEMVLYQYWQASSYAIAASVAESNAYRREYTMSILNSIGYKTGAITSNSSSNSSNKTFLSEDSGIDGRTYDNIPAGDTSYEQSTFDDIAAAMGR